MKTRMTIGAAMLLTIGSAVAGTMMYQKDKTTDAVESFETSSSAAQTSELTPELIAKWKVTSATADYSPPMLPI